MFAVEIYAAVRKFDFIEGNSRREAAREFGLSPTQNSKSQINPGASPAFRVLGRDRQTKQRHRAHLKTYAFKLSALIYLT